jgi:hypothetical protein
MSPKLHHRSKHVVPLKSAQCSVGEVKYRRSTRVVFAEVVGVSRRRRTESKCTFACMSVCICGGISVCMYIHACMCVCVCVRARTFLYAIYPYIHTLQKYTNACTLYTYISMHVHTHTYMYRQPSAEVTVSRRRVRHTCHQSKEEESFFIGSERQTRAHSQDACPSQDTFSATKHFGQDTSSATKHFTRSQATATAPRSRTSGIRRGGPGPMESGKLEKQGHNNPPHQL